MKVSVIGCGSIGRRHARNLVALGHDPYILDQDHRVASLLAHDLHLDGFNISIDGTDWSDIDAVLICTPAETHAQTLRALRREGYAGPLFVEKPICTSLLDADDFRTWPNQTTMVGYNWRFNEEVFQMFRLSKLFSENQWQAEFSCRTNIYSWPGRAYGDALLECSHEIDLALAWLDDAAAPVEMVSSSLSADRCAVCFSSDGCSIAVDLRWHQSAQESSRSFLLRTEHDAVVQLHPGKQALTQSYQDEIAMFLSHVAAQEASDIPFSQGLRVLQVCETIRAAGR